MNEAYETPIEDLRRSALSHYDELATKACHFSSDIPKAINFYYDSKVKERERSKDFRKWVKFMIWLYLFIAAMTIAIAYWVRIS